jgi:peroxiredoxin
VRPVLDELGPIHWQPSPAPQWTLNNAESQPHTFPGTQRKPTVLIFYLGHGCLHCAEQLKTFGPKVKEFQEAGLDVIAISSDDEAGLKVSIENYKEPVPFTLLANSNLNTFKAYRCHDDFENQPLHGTFIVDGAGMIRWQDIGADPFMDADFVLREAKRLLAQKPEPTRIAAEPSVGAQ